MPRYFKVVSPKHDGIYTGDSPSVAAQKAGNAIIGDVKSGSEKKTIEIVERGNGHMPRKYTVTKTRLSKARSVDIKGSDGTTRTIKYHYDLKTVKA